MLYVEQVAPCGDTLLSLWNQTDTCSSRQAIKARISILTEFSLFSMFSYFQIICKVDIYPSSSDPPCDFSQTTFFWQPKVAKFSIMLAMIKLKLPIIKKIAKNYWKTQFHVLVCRILALNLYYSYCIQVNLR